MTRYYSFADLKAQGRVDNRTTLKRWIDAGRFPAPLHPGPNTARWTDDMLREHDARLLSERDAKLAEKKAGDA